MPPAKKIPVEPTDAPFLKKGDVVNVVNGGRTLTNYQVLGMDEHFIKFRGSETIAPQTLIVLIPWDKVEAIGLVGAYE